MNLNVTQFCLYQGQYCKVLQQELDFLPRKGYKCITVPEEIHSLVREKAKESNRTIGAYVEYLLNQEKARKAE